MKFFFHACVSWWFATMVPVHKPLNTLAVRENMRKRRIQSVTLFFSLLMTLIIIIIYGFERLVPLMLLCCGELGCQLLALWLNRRGHMELACLLFFGSESFITFVTVHIMSLAEPIFMLWAFSPIILILIGAAIFLPVWMLFA